MKKFLLTLAFVVAYVVFLSMGLICLLSLVSVCMFVNGPVIVRYPRFVPFCVKVGFLALIALIVTFVIHSKTSKKLGFSKKLFWIPIGAAALFSIPMLWPWEALFDFLRNVF